MPLSITTERVVLRCWERADAPLLREAVESSLPELRRWMDWAANEPAELEVLEERLTKYREQFLDGTDYVYGIFHKSRPIVLGGTGLHPRVGPDALEIGYWIRTSHTGRGLATEVARALTRTAFEDAGVSRVEIRCDPDNARSAAIPKRLGYRLREVLPRNALTPLGEPRDTMVWEITQEDGRE